MPNYCAIILSERNDTYLPLYRKEGWLEPSSPFLTQKFGSFMETLYKNIVRTA